MVNRGVVGVGVAFALLLASITLQRVRVWQSDRTLWADAVLVTPTKPRPLLNHGNELVKSGRVVEGLTCYTLATIAVDDPRRPIAVRREIVMMASENRIRALLRR